MESVNGLGVQNKERIQVGKDVASELAKSHGYGFVESFSGPGGISLGMEQGGFRLLYAFDSDPKAVETHRYNFGDTCVLADATDVRGEDVLHKVEMQRGDLPLFTGGPPCQGFSKQRRNAHLGDDRNRLILDYLRLIEELFPRFFFFENVAIFGQKRGQKYLLEMLNRLRDYELYPAFYNSADYGLAQTRVRFVVVGRRKDQKTSFQIPAPTVEKWKTVREVLEGFPEPPEDYTDHPDYVNHQRARVTKINIERFSHVPQGGGVARHTRTSAFGLPQED